MPFFGGDKQDRAALPTGATGATNPVDVGFIIVGDIVVDHVADAIDVQPPRCHIGGNDDIHITFLQSIDGALAQGLTQITVQCRSREPPRLQFFSEFDGSGLGAHKNQHAIKFFHFQNPGQSIQFMAALYHQVALADSFHGTGFGGDTDFPGIAEVFLHHTAYSRGHGGRKQCALTGGRGFRQNGFHVVNKTHTQHFVCFVQHQCAEFAQIQTATSQVIQNTPRGADNHLYSAL